MPKKVYFYLFSIFKVRLATFTDNIGWGFFKVWQPRVKGWLEVPEFESMTFQFAA